MVVDEDPKHKTAATKTAGKAGAGGGAGRAGGSKGASLVTAELKRLTPEVRVPCPCRTRHCLCDARFDVHECDRVASCWQELKEAGPKYRQLLAERDLEDAMNGGDDAILGEDASGCSCTRRRV